MLYAVRTRHPFPNPSNCWKHCRASAGFSPFRRGSVTYESFFLLFASVTFRSHGFESFPVLAERLLFSAVLLCPKALIHTGTYARPPHSHWLFAELRGPLLALFLGYLWKFCPWSSPLSVPASHFEGFCFFTRSFESFFVLNLTPQRGSDASLALWPRFQPDAVL